MSNATIVRVVFAALSAGSAALFIHVYPDADWYSELWAGAAVGFALLSRILP